MFPETREQRCWFHKIANVLNCLPKPAQPARRRRSRRSGNAEDREHAGSAALAFAAGYGTKWPKTAAKFTGSLDVLTAFCDYPPGTGFTCAPPTRSSSTFATVRLRQRVTKGPGSRAAGVAMAFRLIESAQARWRAVSAPCLVALVSAGARFESGQLAGRAGESGGDQQAA